MKGRNQRGPLTAGSDIAAPEIADNGDAGKLGEQSWVADLDGKTARWLMADGLAVTANGADCRGAEVLLLKELIDTACRQGSPTLFGNGRSGNFIGAAGAQA
ncbi:hypothetical protein D3C76_1547090 [compost metagenome]